ncbi:UDP-N-acetylmuramate dehydrogenase [Candidatus Gracilibacteria bacterium]|nr:UDP-N-acetylmuramate dehydrogenase [Candidatus Gracilibacteria bacterium]
MNELKKHFPAIQENEVLATYTTFQVGGPADFFYRLTDNRELPRLIQAAQDAQIPYFLLAGGSNVLFDDAGFRGLVIKLEDAEITVQNEQITASSGVTVAKFLQTAVDHALTGMEALVGLPGTIGAAVRGNAGCNGLETKDILLKATIFNPETGKTTEESPEYFDFDYRYSKLKESPEIVLQATFQLQKRTQTPEEQLSTMQEIRSKRVKAQPFGLSIGSFFKNPSKEITPKAAGQLIDEAGLKGKTIGKAQISEKHANFMLNLGGATAEDIKQLARLARDTVQKQSKITLHEEVQILSPMGKTAL